LAIIWQSDCPPCGSSLSFISTQHKQGDIKMLDPKVPLATFIGTPQVRVVTPDGKSVIAWANMLPVTGGSQGIPGKRQEAAVCAAFNKLKLTIDDFMTKADFNHVMGGNGPPRYDFHAGMYYDYGAFENGHPSGIRICTDESLLVAKSRQPRPPVGGGTPPPEGTTPPAEGGEISDDEYGTDDAAALAAVEADKKA
jgi:hypothetical protein